MENKLSNFWKVVFAILIVLVGIGMSGILTNHSQTLPDQEICAVSQDAESLAADATEVSLPDCNTSEVASEQ